MPEGFIFGIVDNGIVLIGMYMGIDIEGWISKRLDRDSNPLLGAVIGATAFNTVSDGFAAWLDPATEGMTLGVIIGCSLVMTLIPVAEKIRSRKNT